MFNNKSHVLSNSFDTLLFFLIFHKTFSKCTYILSAKYVSAKPMKFHIMLNSISNLIGVVVHTFGFHARGSEFGSCLDNVPSAIHHFGVNKINLKLACKLNTEGLALGRLPDRDIYYNATQGPV